MLPIYTILPIDLDKITNLYLKEKHCYLSDRLSIIGF